MTIKRILALLVIAPLCACSIAPGPFLDADQLNDTTPKPAKTKEYPVQAINIAYFRSQPPAAAPASCPLTCLTPKTRATYKYRVGFNDQLQVIVWDHPELTAQGGGASASSTPPLPTLPSPGSATGGTASSGAATATGSGEIGGITLRVAGDGTIFFPRVGRVKVVGMTVEQIQERLTTGLAKTIRNPQLDVRITGFNSEQVQILGDVRTPQAQPLTDVPLSIIDAINRAGGSPPEADLQDVGLTRNGVRYTIDVASILDSGNIQQNVLLQDADIVDVPDRTNSRVFVLGEITRPSIVPMNRGKLTLADAITSSGSINIQTSDPHFIYVIRGADKSPEPAVFRLDMTQVDALMLMTRFELQPRDVVYVQIASAARFNRLLDQITPTLQTLFFTEQLAR